MNFNKFIEIIEEINKKKKELLDSPKFKVTDHFDILEFYFKDKIQKEVIILTFTNYNWLVECINFIKKKINLYSKKKLFKELIHKIYEDFKTSDDILNKICKDIFNIMNDYNILLELYQENKEEEENEPEEEHKDNEEDDEEEPEEEIQSKELILRNELQDKYIIDIKKELEKYGKCFIKGPTGFGKTHIYYKLISALKFKKVLFLTPRILLNIQLVEEKYSFYIKNQNYTIKHFSNYDCNEKKQLIKNLVKEKQFILTSCYQSGKTLMKFILKYGLTFDAIFFDEAHFITSWVEKIDKNLNENKEYLFTEFLTNKSLTKYKIFGSATPTNLVEENSQVFGNVIEKVKVYELLNQELLCDIITIVKKIDSINTINNASKKEYHNLKDLIVESMLKYNKKKGIIYVNNTHNAQSLYKLMKKQDTIDSYIYVSKEIDVDDFNDTDIKHFENNNKPVIIIVVGKIGYGYDNDYIDLICLGDPRQSDVDIRQILGRGLRWNKKTYPNKLLHLLIPLYKDEFGTFKKNTHLKKYLDYIIGECGKDLIIKKGSVWVQGEYEDVEVIDGKQYDGDPVPTEILNEYSTNLYNKFSKFNDFLRKNNVYDEITYNSIQKIFDWMPDISNLKEKYPKFCFQILHPKRNEYYENKEDAEKAYDKYYQQIKNTLGIIKWKKFDSQQKLEKIIELDPKIPPIDFDYYY